MTAFTLLVDKPVHLEMTGKFVAPSAEWIHLSRILQDYELIVMTEGVLYLAGDNEQFVVSKGEFLLLPPLTRQYGYKSSDCSFYWLHFHAANGSQTAAPLRQTATRKNTLFTCPNTEPCGMSRKSSS